MRGMWRSRQDDHRGGPRPGRRQSGKRTLCLTIDPARRLAESLGSSEMTTEAQRVDPERLRRGRGRRSPGSLTVMMLDTKSTFDDLDRALRVVARVRDRILQNKLYRYISTSLAGTQEYMAMEKLYAIKHDPSLGSHRGRHAPHQQRSRFPRCSRAHDRRTRQRGVALARVGLQSSGKLSFNLLARGAAAALRGMGAAHRAGFWKHSRSWSFSSTSSLVDFENRADEVRQALRGSRRGVRAGDLARSAEHPGDPLFRRSPARAADAARRTGRQPRSPHVARKRRALPLFTPSSSRTA